MTYSFLFRPRKHAGLESASPRQTFRKVLAWSLVTVAFSTALPALAQLGVPILEDVPINAPEPNPTFEWSPVPGASQYRIAVLKASDDSYLFERTPKGTSLEAPVPLVQDTCYRWWVRAETATEIGEWSLPRAVCNDIQIGKPNPIEPRNWISPTNPTFSWSKDPKAEWYRLSVRRKTGSVFYEEVVSPSTQTKAITESFQPSTHLIKDQCYFWSIRSERAGFAGEWSLPYGLCVDDPPKKFEDVTYDEPIAQMDPYELGPALALYDSNFKSFVHKYFPRLGLPLERERFRGIYFYRDHDLIDPDIQIAYDGLPKPVSVNHQGTDFWVDLLGYDCDENPADCGPNYVVNPFPVGASVWVEGIDNSQPEGTLGDEYPSGNSLTLTCYLDGNRNSMLGSKNKITIDFFHLKQNSFLVEVGDRIDSGQRLAEIGITGLTSVPGLHLHMQIQPHLLDPFNGSQNVNLQSSFFWRQKSVEKWANFQNGPNANLRIDGKFYAKKIDRQQQTFRFTSFHPIDTLYLTESSMGVELGEVDLLAYLEANGVVIHRDLDTHRKICSGGNPCTDVHQVHVVEFDWTFQLPMLGEWTFRSGNASGPTSNEVFIEFE